MHRNGLTDTYLISVAGVILKSMLDNLFCCHSCFWCACTCTPVASCMAIVDTCSGWCIADGFAWLLNMAVVHNMFHLHIVICFLASEPNYQMTYVYTESQCSCVTPFHKMTALRNILFCCCIPTVYHSLLHSFVSRF